VKNTETKEKTNRKYLIAVFWRAMLGMSGSSTPKRGRGGRGDGKGEELKNGSERRGEQRRVKGEESDSEERRGMKKSKKTETGGGRGKEVRERREGSTRGEEGVDEGNDKVGDGQSEHSREPRDIKTANVRRLEEGRRWMRWRQRRGRKRGRKRT